MSSFTDAKSGNKETPSQGVRENREDPLPVNPDVASDGSEEGEIRTDLPVPAKRKRSPPAEEEPISKKPKPAPELIPRPFRLMRKPIGNTPCVISVDQNQHLGNLYTTSQGFATVLFLNPGSESAPTVSLGFKTNGSRGSSDLAHAEWDTEAIFRRRWAISQFEHGHAGPNTTNPRMSDPNVLKLCSMRDMGELLYIKFESWPQATGYCNRDAFKKQSRAVNGMIDAIFRPRNPYSLEIWFIAPFDATAFRKYCLGYFTDSLRQRRNPLSLWEDPEGNCYTDISNPAPQGERPKKTFGQTMFRIHKKHLAAQHQEDAVRTVAHDTRMADRSKPPNTEEQAMLTSIAGPSFQPAEEQPAERQPINAAAPPPGFVMPISERPSRSRNMMAGGIMKGYMPPSMMGAVVDSDDSDVESNPDAGGDGDGEGQHEHEGEGDG